MQLSVTYHVLSIWPLHSHSFQEKEHLTKCQYDNKDLITVCLWEPSNLLSSDLEHEDDATKSTN